MKLKRFNRLLMLLVAFLTMCVTQVWADPVKCTSTSDLVAGSTYYISGADTYSSTATVMGLSTGGNNFPASTFGGTPCELTLGGDATNGWTFSYVDGSTTYYLDPTNTTSSNYLKRNTSVTNYGKFTISFSNGAAVITSKGKSSRNIIRMNGSIYSCYSSGQSAVYLYKKGSNTPATPYTVTFNAGSNGTCSTSSLTESSAGAGVTLPNVTANTGFVFKGWATTNGSATANAGAAGANYKPSSDCTLYAVYGNLYTVTLGDNSATLTQATEGANVTLPSRTGNATWTFAGWSETNNTVETTTAPTIIKAGDYKPTANVTLYPVYTRSEGGGSTTVTQDYETAVAPTGWTSNSITRTNGDGISPHGGSYWGSIAANGTAYIQYNTALTGDVTVTAYVARTTSNANKGEFKIQTKMGSGSWTDKASLDVKSTTVDEWQTLTWTGSLSTEQVRILYTGGTTAIRAIDDVSITIGTTTNYYVSTIGPATYTASVSPAPTNGSIK